MNRPLIVIGLATFMRPQYLSEALASLVHLKAPDGYQLHLVVVDNDENASAQDTVERFREKIPYDLTYLVEKRRGFPYVKNAAIEEAIKLDASKIAFFDDDAEVTPEWLIQFLKTDSDVVEGVAYFKLPENQRIAPLIRYYYKEMKVKELNTGDSRKTATSTNVFFDIKLVKDWGLRFDETFSISGGSDVHFFTQAYKKGATIKYTHLANIYEKVPATRANIPWLLRRWFRLGTSATVRYRLNYSAPVAAVKILIKALSRILLGLPVLLLLPVSSISFRARQIHRFVFGIGLFAGLFGFRYQEYKKVHGA